MKDNKLLQALYTVFLGVLIALFVGVGIATFYEAPDHPEFPTYPMIEEHMDSNVRNELTVQHQEETAEYDRQYKDYEQKYEAYNRNVSIISLVAAVIFIVAGLVFEKRIKMLSGAIMLGGIFTLLYSIGRGFAADDSRYVFIVLCVSILLVSYLGYRRFVQPSANKAKTSKSKK